MSAQHLDLDALADALAEGSTPPHVQECATCRARLDELAAALPRVSAALASAPLPPVPADLDARLTAALSAAGTGAATADVLPLHAAPRHRSRWLPALGGVAAAAVVAVGALVVTHHGGQQRRADTAAKTAAPAYRVSESGTDYSPSALRAALPGLLAEPEHSAAGAVAAPVPPAKAPQASRVQSAPDPLAGLRSTSGLATCLASLTGPDETGMPLALDYASYLGRPALVVVLPSSKAGKVDVLVVPPGCARADGSLLYFTRLPKP
jgi:hypothetical protein